jgi:hypothetical protein
LVPADLGFVVRVALPKAGGFAARGAIMPPEQQVNKRSLRHNYKYPAKMPDNIGPVSLLACQLALKP